MSGTPVNGQLIAVIEDEEHLAQGLVFNLEAEGYRTRHEADGAAALEWLLAATDPAAAAGVTPAAILLDVMLPGRDGFSIVRELRAAGRYTPVLLLTARGRTEDVVEGFEAGADDYLPKPFDLNVLLARLTALLRRLQWQSQGADVPGIRAVADVDLAQNESTTITSGSAAIVLLGQRIVDFHLLEIRVPAEIPEPARTIRLTLMEADLLRYLLERPDRVIPRKELLEKVWRVHEDTDTRAIDNFLVRLRRYLEPDPAHPVYLRTVRGVGYRFVPGGSERI